MGKYYNIFHKKIIFLQTKQHLKRKMISSSHTLLSKALENKTTITHHVSFPLLRNGHFIFFPIFFPPLLASSFTTTSHHVEAEAANNRAGLCCTQALAMRSNTLENRDSLDAFFLLTYRITCFQKYNKIKI